jgi:hypothetical protein
MRLEVVVMMILASRTPVLHTGSKGSTTLLLFGGSDAIDWIRNRLANDKSTILFGRTD